MYIFIFSIISLIAILLQFNIISLALLLTLLLIYLLYNNKNNFETKKSIFLIIVFLVFSFRTYIAENNNISKINNGNFDTSIDITEKVVINGDFLKTTGYINNEKVIVNYKIQNENEKEYFKKNFYGGIINAKVNIEDLRDKKNYFSFDYKNFNEKKGIYKLVTIEKINDISNEFSSIRYKILNFRENIIKDISDNVSLNKSGYFEALIYGDKSNILQDDINNYRSLGISHLLAISGLHIATLIAIVYKICSYLKFSIETINKILFVVLPVYSFLAGLQPSVVRATSIIIIYILLKNKVKNSIIALLITFDIMLLYNPFYIYDLGFQFSFFITFCLLMSFDFIKKDNNIFIKYFKVSLIATIASIPINIYYFYTINTIAIFSNLLFVPYFTLVLFPLILVSYLIYIVNSSLFYLICEPILNFIFFIQDKLEYVFLIFNFEIILGKTSELLIYLLIVLILYLLICLNKYKYRLSFITIFFIIFIFIIKNYTFYECKYEKLNIANREVYYLRNNSTNLLINTSNNIQNFYNDFRSKENIYDIINDYNNLLNYEGIYKFDNLLLTKTSMKDMGFASNLIGKDKVNKLIVTEEIINNEHIISIIKLAKFKNIDIVVIKNNSVYNLGDIIINNTSEELKVNYLNKEYIINRKVI